MGLRKLRERSIKKYWRRVKIWCPLLYIFVGALLLRCHKKGVFTPPVVNIIQPKDGDTLFTGYPSFEWQMIEGAELYHIQIDKDSDFKTPVLEDSSLASPPFTPPVLLEDGE